MEKISARCLGILTALSSLKTGTFKDNFLVPYHNGLYLCLTVVICKRFSITAQVNAVLPSLAGTSTLAPLASRTLTQKITLAHLLNTLGERKVGLKNDTSGKALFA